jgi:histidine ammonia-lyase
VPAPDPLILDGFSLATRDVADVARHGRRVRLAPDAIQRVQAAERELNRMIEGGTPVYGVTTGFGALDRTGVGTAHRVLLQRNLLLSHAAGVGRPLPRDVVRAMLLARANVLAQGLPAVRLTTLEALLALLERDVCPVVPEKGSLGACGDLQALAHLVLPLIGEGQAEVNGRVMSGGAALAAVGLAPIELAGRDGLALINGSEQASATAALVVEDARRLLPAAAVAAALATEALNGLDSAFDEWTNASKVHPGQQRAARWMRRLLAESGLAAAAGRSKLRDALSIRCIPQVLGAAVDALDWAHATVERELNSANDNPLVDAAGHRVSSNSGNFHGQAVAQAMDTLASALTSVGVIADRRAARLVDEKLSDGLPAFLVRPPAGEEGAHNGFMLAQYTAAALVAENRILSVPAATQAVPVCANSEDHVSMAPLASRKAAEIVENVTVIVAVELLLAAQGLDFRDVRAVVPPWTADRWLAPDIEAVARLVRRGDLFDAVEQAIGTFEERAVAPRERG